MRKIEFTEIDKLLGKNFLVRGIDYSPFNNIKTIFEADEDSITWINPSRKDGEELLKGTKSKLIVCASTLNINNYLGQKCFLIVENPKAVFTRILSDFFEEKIQYPSGIHPTAIVSPEANIAKSVHIGAYCIIGKCTIGENSIILPYTRVHNNTFIGNNVKISEFCNIGGDGFGHIWNEDREVVKMPHIGKVIIEDDVEILQYVNIDKGTLDRTLIKKGAILDHYVHIGHNSTVGENTMIGAKAVMCGGSCVGNNTFIGIQTIIIDAMKVGNNVMIGAGSVVTKTVNDGEIWTGSPARPLDEFISINRKLRSL